MKPKLSRILKDLRALRELTFGRRFANQSTVLDLMRLAKETLPNATPLTPEKRVSINEFFAIVNLALETGATNNPEGRVKS